MTEQDPHRHLWCVYDRYYECGGCGLVAIGKKAWCWLDRAAYLQFIDPSGLQREFMCAVGQPLKVTFDFE